ncbi:hypothetical protein K1T71_005206 [Dendrolimus kikuchii]|uniref:Uncharacterized protein n=1 Tax=Dendrolimus kikuchii TaxID=765133 RepID=A0ACC1D6B5_9NEOP|nr:hypothetical protein K1T71_005206 [Dendrolimus kikuchii]
MSAKDDARQSVEEGEQSSKADALDKDQHSKDSRSNKSSSSSSSSEVEEGFASPPPNKRRRYKPVLTGSDPRVDCLMQQVSFLTQYITQAQVPQLDSEINQTACKHNDIPNSLPFLNMPMSSSHCKFSLGELDTEFDERSVVPQASQELLQELAQLQKFCTPAWKSVHYKKALQTCLANPGFTGLKLNEELCHFNKTKDYLASTEQLLAGLSHNVLEQRQLLKKGLQEILDWASSNPKHVNVSSLFEKINQNFGPGSTSFKKSETAMQIICGKRAECIDIRRERILKEITNPNLKNTLRNVPPSPEYLFSREALQPIIASLGGSQVWLNTPNYIKEKRVNVSKFQNKQPFKSQGREYNPFVKIMPPVAHLSTINSLDCTVRTFRGGCLQNYTQQWKQLGANNYILKLITGCRIPFTERPPLQYPNNQILRKYVTNITRNMTDTIYQLKLTKILETPSILDPSFLCRMFLIKKSDGGFRPIFDLRGLNSYVTIKHFHLISQTDVAEFLQRDDWLVKIDIHQAYFHLPIAESHRRFLRVVYNGEILQLTALPFGLSSAPKIFATITNWIAEILRRQGLRVIVYLDDFLVANQDRTVLISQVTETLRILEILGWHVNYRKSVLEPSQTVEYLGLIWDTKQNILKLPYKKIEKIRSLISKTLNKGDSSLKEIPILLGLLNFANYAIQRGRLHCRQMQRYLKSFKKNNPRKRRCLSLLVQRDLRWWLMKLDQNSTPIIKKNITHYLTTDAADAGWGAQLNDTCLSGEWAPYQRPWHSNLKEMYAVFAAINSHRMTLKDAHILIQSDNRTLVAYLRNEGGTQSLALLKLTARLLKLTELYNITLSATYLPGRLNGIADRLSRGRKIPEWHLLPQATEEIFRRWGVSDVDLFATRRSAVVPKYVTLDSRDGYAVFCDAFSQKWDFQLGWIFPPPNLIPRVLAHLNSARGIFILIAPEWTRCFWIPDLKARTISDPIPIQNLGKVLVDLTTNSCPPQVDKLALFAWKIMGGPIRSLIGQQRNKTY